MKDLDWFLRHFRTLEMAEDLATDIASDIYAEEELDDVRKDMVEFDELLFDDCILYMRKTFEETTYMFVLHNEEFRRKYSSCVEDALKAAAEQN